MKHTITIIYFTDNAGKARTIEFSLKNLVLLAAGIFILAIVAISSIIFSVNLYIEKDRLTKEFASIRAENSSLQGKIEDMKTVMSKIEKSAAPANNNTTKPQTKNAALPATATDEAKESPPNLKEKKEVYPVALNDFKVKNEQDKNQVIISFDLVRANSTGESLQGYVFIVGDYEGAYFSFPKDVEMEDGSPVDFRKGNRFAIKWQKHIEQVFPFSLDNIIKVVNVFVYSEDGNLMIKKEVEL